MSSEAPTLDDFRAAVDAELHDFLSERKDALPESSDLVDELAGLVSAGGKRLRPSFCYWGYRAAGGLHGIEVVRAAASLELLHTFAIVHDDIMDAADTRRGRPAINARRGDDFALLAGDLALVLADALFVGSGFDAHAILRSFDAYSRMRQEVIAGQYLEFRQSREPVVSEEEVRRIAVLKSGRYSVEEPLIIGAGLAGATDEFVAQIRSFGAPAGEAFQLRDDLLGTFGDATSVGKPVDSDIREGKRNLLYARAVASLAGEARDFLLDRWGAGGALTEAEVGRLRKLIESSGARAATEATLEDLLSRARGALDGLAAPDPAKHALLELATLAAHRHV